MRASILLTPAAIPDSDKILNAVITPVLATCVPPQNSFEKSPMETTRTVSPYFSPKRALAPVFLASSMFITCVTTSRFSAIFSFTIASTLSSSSLVIAEKCVKSKRSLSGVTREPACSTCVPSTTRSASCKRCVALWFLAVAALLASSTLSVTLPPTRKVPHSTTPTCPILPPLSLMVSTTLKLAPSAVVIAPTSAVCPPIAA